MDTSNVDLMTERLATPKGATDDINDNEDSSSTSRQLPREPAAPRGAALFCLFCMVFSSMCVCLCGASGIVGAAGGLCPPTTAARAGMSSSAGFLQLSCESVQDLRAFARIAFFPLVCYVVMSATGCGAAAEEEGDGRRQSHRSASLDEILMASLLL